MKKTKLLVAVISAGMLFASCESKGHEEHQNHDGHSEMESHEGHNHDEEGAELGLNKGEKWQVNAEMMIPVRDMENRIKSFTTDSKTDYSVLAAELKSDLDKLTSSCSMTGESHDQLHLWLLPHMELVDELSKETNSQKSDSLFAEIQASMITFNNYFK